MTNWEMWHWDGLGWGMFGPLGDILNRAMGHSGSEDELDEGTFYPQTRAGDFGLSLMALLPPVVKADREVSQPELDFVHYFFMTTFDTDQADDLMELLGNILELDYSMEKVCSQIQRLMDQSSRLLLIYLLFQLAQADERIDPEEIDVIRDIGTGIGLSAGDFQAIKAMFIAEEGASYRVLQIDLGANREAVDLAYQEASAIHDPERVSHLGEEFQDLARKKLRALNDAHQTILGERGWN
ncbi:MAG: TerB family tellurite resistance protein [Fidelibacterota bacterium]|nr:MAG: TerB family tellurite resistance protein [Candidatus Neomarinimicrobiota bacterium]